MSVVVAPVQGGVTVGRVDRSVVAAGGRLAETKVIKAPESRPVKPSKVKPGTKRR